jgi:diaminopimelate epimerase
MRFSTWQAHGNVYLLVEDEPLTPERASTLAREHDTDGVLEVLSTGEGEAEIAIWNPDGSQAEMSGNGTRIAARWLAERSGRGEVAIRVGSRTVRARVRDGEVEQELGRIEVGEAEVVDGVELVRVSVGNPHAVVRGDPAEIERIGRLLERHPSFPDGTNVQVARVDAPGHVTARVWERGVGETRSSGTSAVAVAAATHGDGDVVVTFPGGQLAVRLQDGQAYLTGPADRV